MTQDTQSLAVNKINNKRISKTYTHYLKIPIRYVDFYCYRQAKYVLENGNERSTPCLKKQPNFEIVYM